MAEETPSVFVAGNEQNRGEKGNHRLRWLVLFFSLLIITVGGFFLYKRMTIPHPLSLEVAAPATQDAGSPSTSTSGSENNSPTSTSGKTYYESENFHVGDIALGGESQFLLTGDTPEQLTMSEIRGEAFAEKNKTEIKLSLTWKTNKLTKSVVTYSRGVGQAVKTVSENDYNVNHSLIISGLDQATTYYYTIVSKDRFGNEMTSDQHAVYTGSKTVSLFDVIAGAIGDVFGWAIKKN